MMGKKNITIGLAGNPNCGKTTLFNGLTGGKQKIGNWPGVTVEKKVGIMDVDGARASLVDLPGIYSLTAHSEDEKVARDFILNSKPDFIINIIDAANLERNLYLTTQLIEMNVPVIAVLNRIDIALKEKIDINIRLLSEQLDCPVIAISAIKKNDVKLVSEAVAKVLKEAKTSQRKIEYPNEIEEALSLLEEKLTENAAEISSNERWTALKLLEEDPWVQEKITSSGVLSKKTIKEKIDKIESILNETPDIIIADYRYAFIHGIITAAVKKRVDRQKMTDRIDRIVLNRVLGLPIFIGVMYLIFWVTMTIGGAFIDFFDIAFGTVFVDGLGALMSSLGSPEWLVTMFAGGIGAGIQTVSTFIPIIFAMFFMLSLLEDSGYMARAAFVMDRFMRTMGLPGKSFVPMLVGFGCTVPAIMATRTLETRKDRLLTIFMAPFMSCGARLPVYVLFAAAFFPQSSGLMVLSLYLAGIGLAVLTGLLLKKTLFRGDPSHFVMELPLYNPPRMKHILIHTWQRLKQFIFRAGKVIVVVVMVLAFLNSLGTDGSFGNEDSKKSVLSVIGRTINPLFEPMGVEENNWPASVAVFTGVFAKEAVVGTLNALYNQIDASKKEDTGNETDGDDESSFSLIEGLSEALATIPRNLSGITEGLTDPLGTAILGQTEDKEAISEELELDSTSFELMQSYFPKGKAQAYAYLLFILLYFPCVAALGATVREVGHRIAWIQVAYLTLLGWITATLFYQVTTGHELFWVAVPVLAAGVIIAGFKALGKTAWFNEHNIKDEQDASH